MDCQLDEKPIGCFWPKEFYGRCLRGALRLYSMLDNKVEDAKGNKEEIELLLYWKRGIL